MQYLVWSSTHSETQELIPKLFRWSSFVMANIPLAIGIAILPNTRTNVIGFQAMNQAYNFGINIWQSGREVSAHLTSFILAVVSSTSVAYLTDVHLISRLNSYSSNFMVNKIPATLGVSSANLLNLFYARYRETTEGIEIKNGSTG